MRCGFVADTSMRLRIAALVCRFNCNDVVNVGFTTGCFIGSIPRGIRTIFNLVSVLACTRAERRSQTWKFPVPSARKKSSLPVSAMARSILRLHPARAHHAPAAKRLEEHEPSGTNQCDTRPDIPKASRDAAEETKAAQRRANDTTGAVDVWIEEFRHGQAVAYPLADATGDKKTGALKVAGKPGRWNCSRCEQSRRAERRGWVGGGRILDHRRAARSARACFVAARQKPTTGCPPLSIAPWSVHLARRRILFFEVGGLPRAYCAARPMRMRH